MKKLLLFIIAFVFVGCTSPEKKAQKLIKEHLKTSMLDWKSYEPVKFGQLDSVFTTVYDNLDFCLYENRFRTCNELFEECLANSRECSNYRQYSQAEAYLKDCQMWIDSMDKYKPLCDSIENNFVSKFKGWSMTHTFRGNNALGNKTIGTHRFYFDIQLTKITQEKDVE